MLINTRTDQDHHYCTTATFAPGLKTCCAMHGNDDHGHAFLNNGWVLTHALLDLYPGWCIEPCAHLVHSCNATHSGWQLFNSQQDLQR